jgi:hypothetical protein
MNKKITYLIWFLLLSIAMIAVYFALHHSEKMITVSEPDFSASTPFLNTVYQCPDNTDTSDRFVCISNLADTTVAQANTLANKLITQSSVRLKEITSTKTGPVSFVYGGEDFLKSLPEAVGEAQKTNDQYITSVCNLAEMNIFGGGGMDLEKEACRYYYTDQYLKILKNLEGGLTTER